ncbi:MAG: hypothetical protein EZS28_032008 [Streblomastix strix]|uniref:Uncharacterized protein n=1 Tax=Streblomastix strix TaxID=222440 RepID=A0A5J4URN0_9EUKA|nr:MAG: hypothetical protein EZS28_032008 [Streblomastix strix]
MNTNERKDNVVDIEVASLDESKKVEEQEQIDHKIKKQRNVPETDISFFSDSDTKQRDSSDHNINGDFKTDQKPDLSKSQERQEDMQKKNIIQIFDTDPNNTLLKDLILICRMKIEKY